MKIEVKMTADDLFHFSMYSANSGFMGIFNLIFTVGALALLLITWGWVSVYQKVLLVACALIFTVLQPALLKVKSKKQAATVGFSTPIVLDISDEKIRVEQAGVTGDLEWNQIWCALKLKTMYILKVGPTHGYLIPFRSVEGREKEFVELVKRNLPEKKTKGLKE